MFRQLLMALSMTGVLSVASLGMTASADAHCGYGGYGAYYAGYAPGYAPYYAGYGPGYAAPYYAGYPVAYPAPVVVYPHRHYRHHDGIVVSFGF